MEKLELKHLAGYLPYGLKMYWEFGRNKTIAPWELMCNSLDFALNNQNKPILHPFSDLTKEIEVNGVKFIPADIINRDFCWDYVRNNMRLLLKDESYILVGYLPVLVVDKLLEWHFDIYGLIEKGLAIDINKI